MPSSDFSASVPVTLVCDTGGLKANASGRVVVHGGVEHENPEMLMETARAYALEYVSSGDFDESYFDDPLPAERARAVTIEDVIVRADVAVNPELITVTLGDGSQS